MDKISDKYRDIWGKVDKQYINIRQVGILMKDNINLWIGLDNIEITCRCLVEEIKILFT
jgi:hypothetical protein